MRNKTGQDRRVENRVSVEMQDREQCTGSNMIKELIDTSRLPCALAF